MPVKNWRTNGSSSCYFGVGGQNPTSFSLVATPKHVLVNDPSGLEAARGATRTLFRSCQQCSRRRKAPQDALRAARGARSAASQQIPAQGTAAVGRLATGPAPTGPALTTGTLGPTAPHQPHSNVHGSVGGGRVRLHTTPWHPTERDHTPLPAVDSYHAPAA